MNGSRDSKRRFACYRYPIGSVLRTLAGRLRAHQRAVVLGGLLLLGGCVAPLAPRAFAGTTPAFDPVVFWTGRTTSWGVIENGEGAPTAIITTMTDGTAEGDGGLHMIQHVLSNGKESVREWHIRRRGGGQFEATANDVIGTARGSPSGRTLHWVWILVARPGNCLFNIRMEQWMYLADNGTLMNRTIITKFGIRLAEISEQFVRGKTENGVTSHFR